MTKLGFGCNSLSCMPNYGQNISCQDEYLNMSLVSQEFWRESLSDNVRMDGESQTPGGKPRRSRGHLAGWSLVTESSSVTAFPSWLLAVLQFQRFLPAASCTEPLTTCGWCLTPAPVFPVPLLCWSCFKPAKSILLHWRTWQRPFPWGSDDTEPVFLRQSWLSRSCLVSGLFLLVCLYVCFSRN